MQFERNCAKFACYAEQGQKITEKFSLLFT
jgi:hypothetical protein